MQCGLFSLYHEESPFICNPLETEEVDGEGQAIVSEFGGASRFFETVIVKLFNAEGVIPGNLLHGIVYFKVTNDVTIYRLLLNGENIVRKLITGKKPSETETVGPNTFFY